MQPAPKSVEKVFPIEEIRKEFPILSTPIRGKPLTYLDNAATTQKPRVVIDRLEKYYAEENANIHRGVYYLSEKATDAYEKVRTTVARFINARSEKEIIFTRGTTEAINLVANSFGRLAINRGDEIVISALEHHSNIVPWQMLCEERGAILRVIPMNEAGELRFDEFQKLLTPRVKLISVGHISNALGTVNPVKEIVAKARAVGARVLLDGAQAVAHTRVDVRDLGCDFYAFSGHKVFGPTGIGVLYGREALLDAMPPYQGGGDMIRSVTFEKTTYNTVPYKFEAGTPHIAGVIGLGTALDYLTGIGLEEIARHEADLLQYAVAALRNIDGLRLIGTAREKAAIISFTLGEVHPHDIGTILDEDGIAIRAGHHCAQPIMSFYGIPATARASFALYNTKEEIDLLVQGISRVRKVFG